MIEFSRIIEERCCRSCISVCYSSFGIIGACLFRPRALVFWLFSDCVGGLLVSDSWSIGSSFGGVDVIVFLS